MRGPGGALPAVLLGAVGDDPWARRSALAIARAFVPTGRRVVLIDAALGEPSLHALLGVANEEGLVDHFLFGSSLEGLAQPVEDGSWSFVSAGLPVVPAHEVLGAEAWTGLLAEAAAQEAVLLVYTTHDTPGAALLAERLGAVIALLPQGRDAGALELLVKRPYSVLAVLAPPGPEATSLPPAGEAAAAPERPPAPVLPRDPAERQNLIAELRARQRAALRESGEREEGQSTGVVRRVEEPSDQVAGVPEAGVPAAAAAAWDLTPPAYERVQPPPEEPPPVRRVSAPAPPRRHLTWTLLVLVLLSLIAGAWHFWGRWQERRGAAQGAQLPPAESTIVAPLVAVPDTLDALLPYVIAVEAHQQLPTAESRVTTLRQTLPGVGFLIAPLLRDSTLYYHVMAGPELDGARAQALLDTLIARRIKTGSTPSDIRVAPLAFLVAEYATRDSADTRIAELRRLDIPTYALALGADPPRWRVYAGGYNGPAEADVMRQLLASAGVPDSLVPRTGRTSR